MATTGPNPMIDLERFDKESGTLNVIIDTPRAAEGGIMIVAMRRSGSARGHENKGACHEVKEAFSSTS